MLKYLVLLSLTLIVGCASLQNKSSFLSNYIDQNVTENDAKFIASDFVHYLRDPLPPATTTLIIKTSDTEDKFTPLLIDLLQRNGYGVIYTDQPEKSQKIGINLTYKVMPMDKGIVLVAQYGLTEITRYYVRLTTGVIVPSAPFSVRIDDGGNE
ncbi:hypothetical protein HWV54_02510 [Bartonella alsatica]|uniref:Conjugal transfer protein TrbH n=2 Tax=Bartonella alsatica TaxID=52764 RepID=J0Q126_9HYPH|nr:hypothetical protein [Bartonella alsatica]EJF76239.1 hypothetical protein MEC_00042 [Bartonella alsatica IBS 382]QLC51807.1 hypothetical protein HWV54_02510 [Bartonella alsatica]